MLENENHPDYDLYLEYWQQIRIFTRGMKDVQNYLQDVTSDKTPQGKLRNKQYKARAQYTNFPARTRNALVGSVFRNPAQVELPSGLEYLLDNANGAGVPLEQVAKETVTSLIEVGRHGLFVDYGDAAKIVTYTAENCKNWQDYNGILTRVELITGKDTEKHLIIDDDGLYVVELYKEDELIETFTPTNAAGKRFDFIPFVFCGSVDNSPKVDDMPMWAIVNITQGHYQNSADNEDIAKFMIPTPFVTVTNKTWYDDVMGGKPYEFGNGSVIPVPEGGTAGLIQASENQMHAKMMLAKEDNLIKLGARLITGESKQNQTAEAALLEFSAENSVLDNLVGNSSNAIRKCLEWCGLFMGIQGEIKYQLNREYFDTSIDPQTITANILLLDRGVIAKKDLRDTLRRTNSLSNDRTDEEIDAEVEDNAGGL